MTAILDSGERREFASGAVRDVATGKGRYDLLCPFAVDALAKQLERGAGKYPARNWEQGIPQSSFFDSAMRHLNKVARDETDEDHLLAAFWNLHCMVSQRERVKAGRLDAQFADFPPGTQITVSTKHASKVFYVVNVDALRSSQDACMNLCDDLNGSDFHCNSPMGCGDRQCIASLVATATERNAGGAE